MTEPHKHAALIKAWADGAKIERYYHSDDAWKTTARPRWLPEQQYRLAPAVGKFADLKAAHARGEKIQYRVVVPGALEFPWRDSAMPVWDPTCEYRLAPAPTAAKRPPAFGFLSAQESAALKAAAARGAVIEYWFRSQACWRECTGGAGWYMDDAYRVKPGTDPFDALRKAQDAGAKIETRPLDGPVREWLHTGRVMFDSPNMEYRVKPDPAPKQEQLPLRAKVQLGIRTGTLRGVVMALVDAIEELQGKAK